MTAEIDVNSRPFWYGLASSAQYNAGEGLGLPVDKKELKDRRCREQISTKYQPLLKLKFNDQERPKGFTGLLLAAGAVGGHLYSKWDSQRQSLHYMQAIQTAVLEQGRYRQAAQTAVERQWLQNQPSFFAENVHGLLKSQLEVDGLCTRKLTGYLLSVVTLGVGGALLAVGGFTTNSWLMTAGKIASVAGLFGGTLNCGLHWGDDSKIVNAQRKIVCLANSILNGLVSSEPPGSSRSASAEGGSVPGIPLDADYRPLYTDAVIHQLLALLHAYERN